MDSRCAKSRSSMPSSIPRRSCAKSFSQGADHSRPSILGAIARITTMCPAIAILTKARLLEILFGCIEIAKIAQQRSDHPGRCGSQRGLDRGAVDYFTPLPGANQRMGRISSDPVSLIKPRAASMASSSVEQSRT